MRPRPLPPVLRLVLLVLPLLATGCEARVGVVGPPLPPPIGVDVAVGGPWWWDGTGYRVWDGHAWVPERWAYRHDRPGAWHGRRAGPPPVHDGRRG